MHLFWQHFFLYSVKQWKLNSKVLSRNIYSEHFWHSRPSNREMNSFSKAHTLGSNRTRGSIMRLVWQYIDFFSNTAPICRWPYRCALQTKPFSRWKAAGAMEQRVVSLTDGCFHLNRGRFTAGLIEIMTEQPLTLITVLGSCVNHR